jgi:hypothetical protein
MLESIKATHDTLGPRGVRQRSRYVFAVGDEPVASDIQRGQYAEYFRVFNCRNLDRYLGR